VFFSDSLYRNWTGGYISNKITAIRLVIGSWCLLTLVLLNVYNGMLFSFVTTTPRASPLVNSVEDVATNPNVFLILNKGLGAESTISVWTFTLNHRMKHSQWFPQLYLVCCITGCRQRIVQVAGRQNEILPEFKVQLHKAMREIG
jgi:hypothetical protein